MKHYDLCVIGGGPAGFAAAMRALDFNKSVLLIEKDKLGGAGIYNGALTSKTLWEISTEAQQLRYRQEKYGATVTHFPFSQVSNEVSEAIFERKQHIANHVYAMGNRPNGSVFDCTKGTARLIDKHNIEIESGNGSHRISAAYTILATGSRPRTLTNIPVDEHHIMTSDGIHNLKSFPESLVILGAGVIGCEFSTIFSNFGQTEVHLICNTDRILPFEDPEISAIIEHNLARNKVTIHHNAELREMKVYNGRVQYQLCFNKGVCSWFEVEKALISIGRVPNLENLGIEELGILLNKRGHIDDTDTQTNIENIYAVGDLTADIALVNVGELEGRHAVEKIFAHTTRKLRYDNISTIMFLNPETASVGLNETMAKQQGLNYRVVTMDYINIARAVAMRKLEGFFKILVTDNEEMRVLGMRAIGEHASTAIQAVSLLMAADLGIESLAEIIHPHPSIIEGIQEAMRILLGKPIFRPMENYNLNGMAKIWRDGKYLEMEE